MPRSLANATQGSMMFMFEDESSHGPHDPTSSLSTNKLIARMEVLGRETSPFARMPPGTARRLCRRPRRAERELPVPQGAEHPPEEAVLAAAHALLSEAFKGRVCFACSQPSTRMQRCSLCLEVRPGRERGGVENE
ncbi:hypothetical protein TSOC_010734 [Tetrabaena socialis]|uniref:Uncharacterized protein n=1 Tax=Tetrabaena socialis TaxID=47790 RepID=A0A2J7ZSH9_9CHLO|nr:hypothetical protein TSOC_010734 [Tetrabaena socialis]|eukprot:PNH03224.1 hypothetical protein TSOC_010734 [Tetrabaena socialis]